jgi:Flp pilus assembly protein TadD
MDRALYLYEQAARVEPKNPEIYFQAAIILARKGDRQNALRAAEMALQLDPGQPQFRQLHQQLSGR